ncbi:uncharacterized protein ASPGLDRAFT_1057458 [Aspergillus glaucus CBS 516.65]|uniref:Uncharacterized protein n=1 Tax=Aspergillus glaucus CBS 516.65 TaxID=1160497 RepID=A0A1L9V604_ASPGL|nr:hypothetical protein ASPGLDRAFT_1057458 [Aspergillus glaucus CBS 516.65]OJJ79353.1 hypothetical protein ASPGLDRAFT_1057458 [Aspergillus glaucus CBS 516.65]
MEMEMGWRCGNSPCRVSNSFGFNPLSSKCRYSGLCKSTVRAVSTGRSRTLAAFGTPLGQQFKPKRPRMRSRSTPNANTECARAPIRSGGVGFSPRPDTSTAKILQDFYKP